MKRRSLRNPTSVMPATSANSAARLDGADTEATRGMPALYAFCTISNPARPETRDADLAADLAVGLVEAGLQLIERHLDAQPDSGRAQLFDVSLHVRVTPGLWMVTQQGSLGSLRSLSRQSRG